jgi:hypothetical protein
VTRTATSEMAGAFQVRERMLAQVNLASQHRKMMSEIPSSSRAQGHLSPPAAQA